MRDAVVAAGWPPFSAAIGLLPIEASSALGGRIGRAIGPRLYPVAHERACRTLRALRGDPAEDETPTAAITRMWDAIGRVYAEFATEHRLWKEGRVAVEHPRIPAEIRAAGRPLIVAGLHTGNWELLPIALAYLGHNIVQVYQPQTNPAAERIVTSVRLRAARAIAEERGVDATSLFRLVPPSRRAGIDLVAAIRSGWMGVMFVDDDPQGRCVAPAFSGQAPAHGNLHRVVRLAKMTGATILPAYVERLPDARFVVHFLPCLAGRSSAELATALNAALAAPARRLIDQWFMLPSYRLPARARPA